FQLLDLSNPTTLTPGTPVTGTLTPGNATQVYRFTAAAGENYYFDGQSVSAGSVFVRVLDPFGKPLVDSLGNAIFPRSLLSEVDTQVLPFSGVYTLLVEGAVSNAAPSTYKFNVQKVDDTTAALTIGTTTNGAITQTGQKNSFTFNLTQASRLAFDSLTNDSQLNWTLTGPRGVEVSNRSFSGSDSSSIASSPAFDLIAGDYTLTVDANVDHTGSYSFQLLDLSNATTLTPGTPVTGTLIPGKATQVYRFAATAGESYYFDGQSVSAGSVFVRVLDPFGKPLVDSLGNAIFPTFLTTDVDTRVLPFTGVYTLLIEGAVSNAAPSTYKFNVQKVDDTTAALVIGTTTSGAITQTGQKNNFTFSLTQASRLAFDSLTNDSQLNWTLTGPRGVEVNTRSFTASDSFSISSSPAFDLIAGDYTLTVDATLDHTGSYSFQLLDLSNATTL